MTSNLANKEHTQVNTIIRYLIRVHKLVTIIKLKVVHFVKGHFPTLALQEYSWVEGSLSTVLEEVFSIISSSSFTVS